MKQRPPRALPFPGGARIFQRMYTRLGCQGRPPRCVVEYYPYANLTHTIRLREDAAHVRFSDLLRGAAIPVLEAAAAVLVAKIYRRRLPHELVECYREFSLAQDTRRRLARVRRTRGRQAQRSPRGEHHHLGKIFAALNRRYFFGRLRKPRLGWSSRAWRTQLGCFDPALNQIVISSALDRRQVPRHVVESVMFHEMLHVKHPLHRASCGLQAHSARFRREEKRFAQYERARRFLELMA